jgi:hypothetical protein
MSKEMEIYKIKQVIWNIQTKNKIKFRNNHNKKYIINNKLITIMK